MANKNTAIKKAQQAQAQAQSKSKSKTSTTDPTTSEKSTIKSPITTTKPIISTFKELQTALKTTYNNYFENLTPKLKLIDLFLLFLVILGILQFIYVLLVGNFPFNAFLGGFSICVGQFVLLVSLRLQINDTVEEDGTEEEEEVVVDLSNKDINIIDIEEDETKTSKRIFKNISPERSFGDFIFASLILHFIVIHFIN
ncbi:OST2 [Candida pseudojiufengensis]|uniref:OST2 n=1 Tax=Candida pseudojiufengensis TaxID=497109 RepID=UPI00222492E3|nr:OST2 [Candida pseudojiufengensis]KAI5960056.1 OST2 [Candida pseudojiufengensis]